MKILHISDTHGQHHQLTDLPSADIIIHSGDITEDGNEEEAFNFINWFCDLPYKHKIFIAGNHDCCLCGGKIDGLPNDVHYLLLLSGKTFLER
jgi:3',5'-cyclic AMP phosphodiesterase CpdA